MSVPRLRFKDDGGRDFPAWEEKGLFEALTPEFREVVKPKGNYLSIGVRSHCKGTFQKPETDSSKNSMDKLFVVHEGDLIVNITFAWEGAIAIVKEEDHEGYVSHRFPTYRFKPNVTFTDYFQYVFLHPKFREALDLISPGGAGRNRVLSKKEFLKIAVNLPVLKEQIKIANFLTAVDEKIHLLTQKHDLLTQHKKGVMQQIFSHSKERSDSTVSYPRGISQKLRFKDDDDGKDFPEWEEKTLDEVCICLDNKRKPLNDAERQTMQGEIPYWGANNIMDYVNDYIFDETIVLLAEDGGNFNEYKTRPIANISHGKCWVNNHTHVLKGKTNLSNEFLFYSLVHKNITGYVSGGTRAKLTKGEMLKILIDMPSPKEQNKIANFLTAVDEKITATKAQLAAVKQYKQGLLQQMFV